MLLESMLTVSDSLRGDQNSLINGGNNQESNTLSATNRQILWLVISQINLVLSLVNDTLDLSLIEKGKFFPKIQSFSPTETFRFIIRMFTSQMKMQDTNLTFEPVVFLNCPNNIEDESPKRK